LRSIWLQQGRQYQHWVSTATKKGQPPVLLAYVFFNNLHDNNE
jgi:hypothetical protein